MTFMMKLRALFVRHTPAMRAYFAAVEAIPAPFSAEEDAAAEAWYALSDKERAAVDWINGIDRRVRQ